MLYRINYILYWVQWGGARAEAGPRCYKHDFNKYIIQFIIILTGFNGAEPGAEALAEVLLRLI
jgi:hypothetical protein